VGKRAGSAGAAARAGAKRRPRPRRRRLPPPPFRNVPSVWLWPKCACTFQPLPIASSA
jgi:hypothetical protein